jgi:hypothetical protein
MGKVTICSEIDFFTTPIGCDIYIMDMDIKNGDVCELG